MMVRRVGWGWLGKGRSESCCRTDLVPHSLSSSLSLWLKDIVEI